MKRDLVAVSYDCQHLVLLPDCAIGGEYSYVGLTLREQVIRISEESELQANLPLGGSALTGSIGGGFREGGTLDVALAIAGQKSGLRRHVLRSDLTGQCAGATHFIRSAMVGAFAIEKGSRTTFKTAAQVFGVGASTRQDSGSQTIDRDGSLDACRTASGDAEPRGCAAPLRVELNPILDKPAASAAPTGDEMVTLACPPSTHADDSGKCVTPTSGAPYVCRAEDLPECERECSRGSMGSCAILGRSYQVGRGVAADPGRAVALYDRACRAGVAPACGRLGEMLVPTPGREQFGMKLLRESCAGGWMTACTIGGRVAAKAGDVNVIELFRRGCAGGDAEGCWNLGLLFRDGVGVTKNDAEAVRRFKLACDGGARLGCVSYAQALEKGAGAAPAVEGAIAVLTRACDEGYSASCAELGKHHFMGTGVPADDAKGIALLERACEGTDRSSCLVLGLRYKQGTGVTADRDKALRYLNRACETGDPIACEQATKLRQP